MLRDSFLSFLFLFCFGFAELLGFVFLCFSAHWRFWPFFLPVFFSPILILSEDHLTPSRGPEGSVIFLSDPCLQVAWFLLTSLWVS